MRNGYVQTTVAISVASGILATFGWAWSQFNSVNQDITAKANAAMQHFSDSDQRIAKLEEAVGTIKSDTSEIKGDIKSILKAVK